MASQYKQQAERLQLLRRLPGQQALQVNSDLDAFTLERIQAEFNRPAQLTPSLVQRHFFPAEGAVSEGVGEPVKQSASRVDVEKKISEYQRVVRRRAALLSKAIKAEQDAKLNLAKAALDRLQSAREFGSRVAANNAKSRARSSTRRHPTQVRSKSSSPDTCGGRELDMLTASPDTCGNVRAGDSPCATDARSPPEPFGSTSGRQGASTQDALTPGEEKMPSLAPSYGDAAVQEQAPLSHTSAPQPVQRQPTASLAARQRLMSHSQVDAAQRELAFAGVPVRSSWQGSNCGDPSVSSPAFGFRARVLQPANVLNRGPKIYKGKPLPLTVSLSDEIGFMRITQKVADLGAKVTLPRLCACPNATNPLDPKYTSKCARNCPLYMQPERYESLLMALLRAQDVI